jgi:hypothetical protein
MGVRGVLMVQFDGHAAADDVSAKLFQLGDLFTHPLFHGIRMVQTVERNLHGTLH